MRLIMMSGGRGDEKRWRTMRMESGQYWVVGEGRMIDKTCQWKVVPLGDRGSKLMVGEEARGYRGGMIEDGECQRR